MDQSLKIELPTFCEEYSDNQKKAQKNRRKRAIKKEKDEFGFLKIKQQDVTRRPTKKEVELVMSAEKLVKNHPELSLEEALRIEKMRKKARSQREKEDEAMAWSRECSLQEYMNGTALALTQKREHQDASADSFLTPK